MKSGLQPEKNMSKASSPMSVSKQGGGGVVAASSVSLEKVGMRVRGFRVRRRVTDEPEEVDFFVERDELVLDGALESDDEEDLQRIVILLVVKGGVVCNDGGVILVEDRLSPPIRKLLVLVSLNMFAERN